jgi:hypothetical protein
MIRRRDLVDVGDEDYDVRRDEFMQCLDCGYEFGGTKGDYFTIPMDYVFHCYECDGENIALVRRSCRNIIIKQ